MSARHVCAVRTTKLFSLAAVCPSVGKKYRQNQDGKDCHVFLFFFAQPYRKAKPSVVIYRLARLRLPTLHLKDSQQSYIIPWSGTIIMKHDGLDLIDSWYARLWVFSYYRLEAAIPNSCSRKKCSDIHHSEICLIR